MIDSCTVKNEKLVIENNELSDKVSELLNKLRSFSDNPEDNKEDTQLVPGTTEEPTVSESENMECKPETASEEMCEKVNESVDDDCNDKEVTQESHEEKPKKKRRRNRK